MCSRGRVERSANTVKKEEEKLRKFLYFYQRERVHRTSGVLCRVLSFPFNIFTGRELWNLCMNNEIKIITEISPLGRPVMGLFQKEPEISLANSMETTFC